MDKKVSIILPVYNVSAYLEECIRSLMEQDYKNLEIIPVDDESPDDCGEILDRLAAEDDRIKPIHKKNGGAASARNVGIDAATGEYLCFVDSDDSVEPTFVSHLMENLIKYDADVSACSFVMWRMDGMVEQPQFTAPGVYIRDEYLLRFLSDWECAPVTNKVFRRSCIGAIRMEEGHRIDDEFFTYKVIMNCQRIAVSNERLYRYRIRKSSVMLSTTQYQERFILDCVDYTTQRYNNISVGAPELEDAYFRDALDNMTRYWNHSKDMPNAQKAIRAWINAHRGRLLRSNLSMKQKIAYLISLYLKKPQLCGENTGDASKKENYFS